MLTSMTARKRAFTLIELLTVIAIMAILAGFIGISLNNGGSAAMPASQRTLKSLVDSTRATALLRRSNAYLIIYATDTSNTDPAKLLRFCGIVYNPLDASGNPDLTRYVPANDGVYLPSGTVLVPPSATLATGEGQVFRSSRPLHDSLAVTFPLDSGGSGTDSWIAYGFNSKGQTMHGGDRSPFLVVSPGSAQPTSTGWQVLLSNPMDSRGVWIRPQGTSAVVNDFEELDAVGL
jgi:prepilin-type N-terminal cleavage/methylation domain-containing protein